MTASLALLTVLGRVYNTVLQCYTDKNEKKNFLIYCIRTFRCEVIYEEGLPNIWGNAQIFSPIQYEEAVSHIWLCNRALLDFHIYEENIVFFLISVYKLYDWVWLIRTSAIHNLTLILDSISIRVCVVKILITKFRILQLNILYCLKALYCTKSVEGTQHPPTQRILRGGSWSSVE